jgi:thiol-disulfide isomerase/thioredoxin
VPQHGQRPVRDHLLPVRRELLQRELLRARHAVLLDRPRRRGLPSHLRELSGQMHLLLLLARLTLSFVLGAAAIGKFADLPGARSSLEGFGLPKALARPLGLALPLAEAAIALALLPLASAWLGALAALALIGAMLAVVSVNLAQGRRPQCHCFGQIHSEPIGWRTVGFNLALAGLAAFIGWRGRQDAGASLVSWTADLSGAQAAALIAGALGLILLAGVAMLAWQMVRQQGRLLLRLEAIEALLGGPAPAADAPPPATGLHPDTPAPAFRLAGLAGDEVDLATLTQAGKPIFLVFANPQCGPCQALAPEVGAWQGRDGPASVVVISEGTRAENERSAREHGLGMVLLQEGREVADAYQAWGTPAAVVVSPDGLIASYVASGSDAIRNLYAMLDPQGAEAAPAFHIEPSRRAGAPAPAPAPAGLQIGDAPPLIELFALDGEPTAVTALNGRPTLVLFWNPSCGYCKSMEADLKRWDAEREAPAPELLLVSSGTPEENRALGLKGLVLADAGFQVGSMFGANGTPMAVLLDGSGRVGSKTAAGADAVFSLAAAGLI